MTNHLPFKVQLIASLSLLFSLAFQQAAHSQYYPWGYSPLTGSSSWLWLSRSLFSPSRLLSRGAYGYSTPYYLASTLGWNAAYAVGQGVNAKSRQALSKQNWSNPANGINAPVVDQISAAPWYYPPRVATPVYGSTSSTADPLSATNSDFMPVPATIPETSRSAGAPVEQSQAPPSAPDFRSGKKTTDDLPSAPATSKTATSQNPFAQAFVDHINTKYAGDISQALADKQTRNYARAIGLLEKSSKDFEIPTDRIDLIKRILQDQDEDSLTKVNTIRMLIKH